MNKLKKNGKPRKEPRKRSTIHVNQETFDQLEWFSELKDQAKVNALADICEEIVQGKFDDKLVEKEEEFRSMAVFRDSLSKVKEYVKGYDISATEIIIQAINEKYKNGGQ